jgi:dihydrofolate reductase
MTEITLIAAMTPERVLGRDGDMPWELPEDLQHFKKTTSDGAVVMGRKTFESFAHGRPLPNRLNVILSRSAEDNIEGAKVVHSLEEAIEYCREKGYSEEIFIIGGGSVYKQAIEIGTKMILSEIHEEFEGDTYFPEFGEEWKEVSRDKREGFDIVTYRK